MAEIFLPLKMIEDKLSKNIDKILNELYGNNSYKIQFQKTRK